MQLSFFDNEPNLSPKSLNNIDQLSKIIGLSYIPDFITIEEHDFFWKSVNSENWLGDLKRRVQHYGYKYDYRARFIDYSMKIGELPKWIIPFANRLHQVGLTPKIADQLIVNEYKQGQGIATHIDCEPCFGDTIISLSLGSTCVLEFVNKKSNEKIDVLLEPRSLVVLKDDSRYKWTHGIVGRKSDIFNGSKFERSTRISLTFRNVIVNDCEIK